MFPQCLGRPEGVSEELAQTWLNNVREARPVYRHPFDTALPIVVLPVIGLIGALVATWRARRGAAFTGWVAVALFTAFAGLMLLWQVRAAPAAQLLAVPGATALACVVVPWFLRQKSMLLRVLGPVVAFLLISGLFAGYAIKLFPADKPQSASSARVGQANAACARVTSMRTLRGIPPAIMFTHVDMGPRLIVLTHHYGIAGPYHRNERAILDVHRAFTGPAAGFRAIAARHKAEYVLICPDLAETTVYRSRNPNGFYAMLHQGRAPYWLEPVTLPEGSPFRLWKIRYDLPEKRVSVRPPSPRRPD
jgi:hypothetical protein